MISIEAITIFLVLASVWLCIVTWLLFDLIGQVADLNTYKLELGKTYKLELEKTLQGVTNSLTETFTTRKR